MAPAALHVDEGIEYPQQPQELSRNNTGVVHVVHLKVIGLSGILLDSQKTKATVSKNKDMLIPPRLMKASLAVVRENQVFGVSPDSKRLSRIPVLPAPTSTTQQPQVDHELSLSLPLQPSRPVRRYIAVWDNSTIKTTATSTGEIAASTADSTILFETTLVSNPNSDDIAICASPHKNFELIVGLVSPTSPSAKSGTTMTTIPIGVASLPINEAAALRGSSGRVVLDLPIFNISAVGNDTNPFVVKSSMIETESEPKSNVKVKRNIFSVIRRRKKLNHENATPDTDSSNKAMRQPCIYTLDASTDETATLRVELELHEKESNVEMGLSYSDEPYSIVTNWTNVIDDETKEVVLTVNVADDDVNSQSIETSSDSILPVHKDFDESIYLEQSIERVLSIRNAPSRMKSLLSFSPVRRFSVKYNDKEKSKFDLTLISTQLPVGITTETIEEESDQVEDDIDIKARFLDVTIERILSMKESDDDISPDQLENDEDDVPLNKNDVPFDEQSFLSRDTAAILPTKRSTAIKKLFTNQEQSIVKPPKLDLKSTPPTKTLKVGSFWNRGSKNYVSGTSSFTPSITGTESSTHSISNTDSDIDSPVRVGIIKKVLLPDANNMLKPSVIDVLSSDHGSAREESVIISKGNDEQSASAVFGNRPIVKPVSILRKSIITSKAIQIDDLPSTPTINTFSMVKTIENKLDAASVVSSSAETEVMKTNSTKPPIDYEDHFNNMIKDLSDAKTPVSDGPDTDATESIQSLSTNTTPPSPDSAYSSSLPSFVEEANEPVIWEEKFAFNADDLVVVKAPKKKYLEISKPEVAKVVTTESPNKHQSRTNFPKKNMFAQNLYGLIDIQPCSGKLDQFLVPNEEELMSVDESWINENSTIDTYKTQRKVTIHDDLADLGLLWGDMCRQTGFRGNDDDSFLVDESITKEKKQTKQRWMAGLRKSMSSRKAYEYDEIDEGDHSESSDGGSFTDENTFRSTTEESESGFSEQGTEIDVNDVDVPPDEEDKTATITVAMNKHRVKSSLMMQLGGNGSRFVPSIKAVTDDNTLGSTSDVPSLSGLSARLSNRRSKINIDEKTIDKHSLPTMDTVKATAINRVSSLPPKVPKAKTNDQTPKAIVETVPVRHTVTDGSYTGGSNIESANPQSFLPPKSMTQSLVDFVEYVISPSPTPSAMLIPNVPTELDADDAASVGELTATTYERQVDVDEMRRLSETQQQLSPESTNVDNYISEEELLVDASFAVNNNSYFSEYNGNDGISSPEVAAAMEAAAAKQMADILH